MFVESMSHLLTLAADAAENGNVEFWAAIIAAVLGPGGVGMIFKKFAESKQAIIDQKDKQIQNLLKDKQQIEENAHARTRELIDELKQLIPVVHKAAEAEEEASRVIEKVMRRLEADERINQEEIQVMRQSQEIITTAMKTLAAFSAKYELDISNSQQ